jgi:hypothetical protein
MTPIAGSKEPIDLDSREQSRRVIVVAASENGSFTPSLMNAWGEGEGKKASKAE